MCEIGQSKKKRSRMKNLRSWEIKNAKICINAEIRINAEVSHACPTLAVSLFCQYLCSGAPVRSRETIYCPLARDHAQVTIQPGKSNTMYLSQLSLIEVQVLKITNSYLDCREVRLWFRGEPITSNSFVNYR